MNRLLCLGLGYSARAFASLCLADGWHVAGTTRRDERAKEIEKTGVKAIVFDGISASPELGSEIALATHILMSIAPAGDGDPVLRLHAEDLAAAKAIQWIGYLSTVGVYGDHGGGWVDETTIPKPTSERGKRRVSAEAAWLNFAAEHNTPLQIFRLSGIYGPGRSAIDKVRNGTARRLIKPAQVFNRIHVEDIAGALRCGTAHPEQTGLFNLTDDMPAPPQDVVQFAAELLGAEVPPDIAFESADLSPMARSFYGENKRVRNDRIKQDLGFTFTYPTYRKGLRGIVAAA